VDEWYQPGLKGNNEAGQIQNGTTIVIILVQVVQFIFISLLVY
jgi:hypothetical protein